MSWYKPWTWGDESELLEGEAQRPGPPGPGGVGFANEGQDAYTGLRAEQNAARQQLAQSGERQDLAVVRAAASGPAAEPRRAALDAGERERRNAAMAARTGRAERARLGYGMSGQAATAGIQERMAGVAGVQRRDRPSARDGAAAGARLATERDGAYGGITPDKSFIDKWGPRSSAASGRRRSSPCRPSMTPRPSAARRSCAPEDPFLAWYRSQPEQPVEDPNEIQMPAVDARAPAPTIGFPHDPGPILDQDAAAAAMPARSRTRPMPAERRRRRALAAAAGPRYPDVDARQRSAAAAATGRRDQRRRLEGQRPARAGRQRGRAADAARRRADARAARADVRRELARGPGAAGVRVAGRPRPRRARARDHAELEDQQRQAENHGRWQRAQDEALARAKQLDADAHAEAQREIDPKWKAGTGKRIAGIIMGIVGGLVQSRSGGPNLGLQLIDQEIDRDIEAQKANKAARLQELARRGASNQQLMAFAGDQYAEDEKTRLATYTRVQNQIASDMQQFDPKGKTAIQLGQMYTQIGQARAKALVDFQDKDFKNRVDALKAASALRKEAAETEKLQLESAKLRGALGGAGKGAGHRSGGRRSCSPTTSSRSGCRGRRGRCRATPTRTGSSCERKRTRPRPASRRCRRRSSSTASAICRPSTASRSSRRARRSRSASCATRSPPHATWCG
jgi:hypothetical protein